MNIPKLMKNVYYLCRQECGIRHVYEKQDMSVAAQPYGLTFSVYIFFYTHCNVMLHKYILSIAFECIYNYMCH